MPDLPRTDLRRAIGHLTRTARPGLVAVVDEIPRTSWYRPRLEMSNAEQLRQRVSQLWRREGSTFVHPVGAEG
jgi:hypothetical protein